MQNVIYVTANNTLTSLQALFELANTGTKLADCKAKLADIQLTAKQALSGVKVELPIGTEPVSADAKLYSACVLCADINSERSTAGWNAKLSDAITALFELVQEHAPEVSASAVTRLLEIEQEIKEELQKAANATLKVGELLAEARDDFEKQDAFLVWAEEKFAIRKTQVFRLMKVYKAFADDSRFDGVAIRVLDMLANEPEEIKAKAAELAADGKLTTPELKAIVGGKTTECEKAPEVKQEPEQTKQGPESAKPSEPSSTDKALATLSKQLEEALQVNAELTRRIEELTKPRQQQLPLLPHFSSDSYAIRLGLADNADAKAVRAAYRAIAKFYTPDANKQAYDLLTEAKDNLLAQLEAKAA